MNDTDKVAAEVAALEIERDKVAAEVERIIAEKAKVDAEILRIGVEQQRVAAEVDRIQNEALKINADIIAVQQATINDTARTVNDTTRATNDTNRTVGELSALADKTASECNLLDQKRQTELAQVVDSVSTGTVTGVIGKQKALFDKQAAGFDRDAEQKLAKIMVDSWSVRMSTDGTAVASSAGLDDPQIASVLAKAKAGIQV